MSSSSPLLLVLALVPLAGAVLVGVLGAVGASDTAAKATALVTSLAALALAVGLGAAYQAKGDVFQFRTDIGWIDSFGVRFSLGADGIALVLLCLTTLLVPLVVLAGWNEAEGGRRSVKSFFGLLLVLESCLVVVFSATDVFLFYVFFEAMLIPMYFLIGSYGGPQRQYAAVKFLIYSLVGGLLMLSALIGLYVASGQQLGTGTFDFATLTTLHLSTGVQDALFLGFFVAFAVKAPLFPFHTWLPDAGAEAPTGAAVVLVGVLDKVGTFGFLRYCLPLFPDASRTFAPYVLALGVVGVLYGALVAIGQRDLRRWVAYTSLAHFGFITLGVFAMTSQGGSGAVLYMVNHGLSTGALFLVVGALVTRTRTRDVAEHGGVAQVAPWLGGAFLVAGLSALALPGLSTFLSEFLVLVGTFTRYRVVAVLATLGIVLAALYVLVVYQRAVQGPVAKAVEGIRDLTGKEAFALAPLVVLMVVLGVYPKPVLDAVNPSVERTLQQVHRTDPAPSALPGAVPAALPAYPPGTSPFKPPGGRTPLVLTALPAGAVK